MSDNKIADIRERHKESDNNFIEYETIRDIHVDRATLLDEVDRQRAENEKLRARVRQLEQVREAALNACADWYLSLRVDDQDSMEYVEPNIGLMESMGKLSEIATEANL